MTITNPISADLWSDTSVFDKDAQVMELFVPLERYTRTASAWIHYDEENMANVCEQTRNMLFLFSETIQAILKETPDALRVTFEVVPFASSTSDAEMCGYRLRLMLSELENIDFLDFGSVIGRHIDHLAKKAAEEAAVAEETEVVADSNGNFHERQDGSTNPNSSAKKKKNNAKKGSMKSFWADLTLSSYVKMAAGYIGNLDLQQRNRRLRLADIFYTHKDSPRHPLHPCSVFSIENSLRFAERLKAMPSYCNMMNYRHPLTLGYSTSAGYISILKAKPIPTDQDRQMILLFDKEQRAPAASTSTSPTNIPLSRPYNDNCANVPSFTYADDDDDQEDQDSLLAAADGLDRRNNNQGFGPDSDSDSEDYADHRDEQMGDDEKGGGNERKRGDPDDPLTTGYQYSFPENGKNAYMLLEPSELTPQSINTMAFPHTERNLLGETAELQQFLRLYAGDAPGEVEEVL